MFRNNRLAGLICGTLISGCSSQVDLGPPAGSGTINGTIDARTFDVVAASYIIGAPDDPGRTTVLYVFDSPIACGEIIAAGWDETVPDQSQAIEIKLIGKSPGTYPVASGLPTSGEADVNYTVTSTSGTPSEVSATAGSVTLDAIDGIASATGRFDLVFPGGMLAGSFTAATCGPGREP